MKPGFFHRRRLVVSAAALCMSIAFIRGDASAESAGECKGLLACTRETPVSSLHFGLWAFGNDLRRTLLEAHVFKPTTRLQGSVSSTPDAEVLKLIVIDSVLKCDQLARLLTNYIGHWESTAETYASEEDIRSWTNVEADAHTSRWACLNVATYVAPSNFGGVSRQDLLELCAGIRIEVIPLEKPETKAFSKPCAIPLNNWQP